MGIDLAKARQRAATSASGRAAGACASGRGGSAAERSPLMRKFLLASVALLVLGAASVVIPLDRNVKADAQASQPPSAAPAAASAIEPLLGALEQERKQLQAE